MATIAATAVVVAIVGSANKAPSGGAKPSGGNVYYDQGLYYEQTADGYKVIPPPPGAQIASLPEGYTQVTQAGKQYGYYQGTFYVESDGEYVVTQAPTGAIVPYIPDSATETTKDDGTKLYEYAGTEFQAVSLSGDTSYVVSNS